MRSFLLTALVAATSSLAADSGPNEPLNPNPTDTNNPRLIGKSFPWAHLPEKADTTNGDRGEQSGYNLCNSTTEGPNSSCQTLVLNSLEDFCLWGPAKPGNTVGDAEQDVVAWCTKPGYGTRVIPAGAISGAQFIRTPSYVEITGYINQSLINIKADDDGGELDSGGQDLRGNPIGGLAFSTSMGSSHGVYTQSRTWHAFMGSGVFCMKLCDPKARDAAGLCRHTLDTLGCNVNIPAAYVDNVFETCLGDDQKPVTPDLTDIPASSSCTQFSSTALGWGVAVATGKPGAPAPTPGPSRSSTPTPSPSPTVQKPVFNQPVPSSTQQGTKQGDHNSASSVRASASLAGFAALLAATFFA